MQIAEELKDSSVYEDFLIDGASLLEFASLSYDVYRSDDRLPLPGGWKVYCDIEGDEGYFASCYYRRTPTEWRVEYDLIFSHRGTVNFSNIINDIYVILGKVPDQIEILYQKVTETIDKFSKEMGYVRNKNHTGHSLGAIYAILLCTKSPKYNNAIVFDSLGSKPCIQNAIDIKILPENALELAHSRCRTILADVDIFNNCNEHAEPLYRLGDIIYNYDVYGGPKIALETNVFQNEYYIWGYSINDQHRMHNILNHIINERPIGGTTKQFESGFQNGYIEYLNLPSRWEYWTGYYTIIWDREPGIRERYKNNFDLYLTECFDTVLAVQEVAKKNIFSESPQTISTILSSNKHNFFATKDTKPIADTTTKDTKPTEDKTIKIDNPKWCSII